MALFHSFHGWVTFKKIKWIINKVLLYSIMLRGRLDGRGVCRRMDTCICMAESLCCPPEITTALLIGCTPIQNKCFLKIVAFILILYIQIFSLTWSSLFTSDFQKKLKHLHGSPKVLWALPAPFPLCIMGSLTQIRSCISSSIYYLYFLHLMFISF